MPDLPKTLRLNAMLPAETGIGRIFDMALRLFVAHPDAGITHWFTARRLNETRNLDKAMTKGAPTQEDFDKAGADEFAEGFTIQGRDLVLIVKPIRNGAKGKPTETYGIEKGWWLYVACTYLRKSSTEDFRTMLSLLTGMLPALTETLPPLRAEIRRTSDSFIGPVPPLADPEVVMACLSTDLVSAEYADPDGFWSAWDRVDYLGHGLALVQRGAAVVEETAFKAIALRSGLAMGRAAKPGKTGYFLPDPSEAEQALLDAEESCLEQVGYKAAEHSLEFTAMLEAGAHLPARDLFLLVQYLENGTGGGDPVDIVIVTFPTRAMAEAEARPLQDIGARIQYLSDSGEWVVLEV